jgi:hypothetical protein
VGDRRRKWPAIGAGTFVMMIAEALIVYAFVLGSAGTGSESPLAALALGLALVPAVFVLVAFVSKHDRAPTAVIYAMLLSLLVGLPLAAIDVVTALAAGFGVGGAVTLVWSEDDSWVGRGLAVVLVAVYVGVLTRFIVEAGILAAAILPLVAVGVADEIAERHAERLRRLGQVR